METEHCKCCPNAVCPECKRPLNEKPQPPINPYWLYPPSTGGATWPWNQPIITWVSHGSDATSLPIGNLMQFSA